jgi:sulfur dioxygenase
MPFLSRSSLIFRQLVDTSGSNTFTYLLGDRVTREALLIDPVFEMVERDLQAIEQLQLNLKWAINTHAHADHTTGTGKLKQLRPGVQSVISKLSGATADILLSDDDLVKIGEFTLKGISTPGHTDGCMCFYLHHHNHVPMLFTGDTLLIRGCGRTDFQQGSSGMLYDSVHSKIFSLPGETIVWPAHDYKGWTCSSIEEERQFNPRLTKSREDFIELMAKLNLPLPKKLAESLPVNLKDGLLS